MASIVQFIPRRELDAATNVAAFAELCRCELTIFGNTLDFDANVWEVGRYLNIKGRESMKVNLIFSTFDSSKQTKDNWVPMSEPFLSFAKAYLRYYHGIRPTKAILNRLYALRALERALVYGCSSPSIHKATPETFVYAEGLVAGKFGSAAYRISNELRKIADFCTDNSLTSMPVLWKSSLKRPEDMIRVGKEADERRSKRLPAEEALDALARAFSIAIEVPDVMVTSVAAILCSSPNQINEILRLPVDCEVEELSGATQKNGHKKIKCYGLRWLPSNGNRSIIKWIAPTMENVVREAIRKIKKLTEKPREVARWYEENPGKLYLPNHLNHLRNKRRISCKETSDILGLSEKSARVWCTENGIKISENHYDFEAVERAAIGQTPQSFPVFDPETGLKFSEALFIVHRNEMSQHRSPIKCLIEQVTTAHINDGIGAGIKHGRSSVFSRMGYTEADGTPLKITTSQFRHWLNSLAHRGGMSQLDIAKWSGRVSVLQNNDYDHMTSGELLNSLRDAAANDVNILNLPVEVQVRDPIDRQEFVQMMIPAAHTTELGFCIHDFTFIPCQLHRDCIFCSEHCYIKGDEKRMIRIRQLLIEAEGLLVRAEDAQAENYAGADRWVVHQQALVARLRSLVEIFDDPTCPNGALLKLSSTNNPSKISFAIEGRIQLGMLLT